MTLPVQHGHGRALSIVHVSADFPDAYEPAKTQAIRHLVDLVEDRFEHSVISLNRVMPGLTALPDMLAETHNPIRESRIDGNITSVRYGALPKGLWHRTSLAHLADALYNRLAQSARPDLIVGYKLTVEGLVVPEVARRLGTPYALVLQGDTDTKIIAARPDLIRLFAQAIAQANVVFSFAPWATACIGARLGMPMSNVVHVPCPVGLDNPIAPKIGGETLVSAFHLKNAERKNVRRLAAAFQRSRLSDGGVRLAVIGGGNARETRHVERITHGYQGVSLEGPVPNGLLSTRFNNALGFAMPSLRESFGMVFIEALFCGCPILYPADRAVSGWFENADFAIAVEPLDTGAIAEGLLQLKQDEIRMKSALATWQFSPDAARFRRSEIAETFASALNAAATGVSLPGVTALEHIA